MLYKLYINDMRNKLSHIYLTRKIQENIKVQVRTIESCFNAWDHRLNKSEKVKYKDDINAFQVDLQAILFEIYK